MIVDGKSSVHTFYHGSIYTNMQASTQPLPSRKSPSPRIALRRYFIVPCSTCVPFYRKAEVNVMFLFQSRSHAHLLPAVEIA